MKKVLLMGAGNVGYAIAYDLNGDYELTIGDVDEKALNEFEKYGNVMELDALDPEALGSAFEQVDVVVCALPGKLGFRVIETAIKSGTDVVDVSFMPEDPFVLQDEAESAGVSVIVDAGFGPGLPNLFIGRLNTLMEEIDRCMIRIAGLPKHPEPPLFHSVTWSPSDLIEEYTRPARVIRDGKVECLEPFEDIGRVEVRGMEFEEFYSDGLRTLLDTMKIETIEETTLRWKGHIRKMKVLKELGFFEPERVPGTLDVILPHMVPKGKDISILEVDVEGKYKGEKIKTGYSLYDESHDGFSSMARTTGFTTALMTRLILTGDMDKGILPLESLGADKITHDFVVNELRARGVHIGRKGDKLQI